MKKITPFITTLILILLASTLNFSPLLTEAKDAKSSTATKYTITAMHNDKLISLDYWNTNRRDMAITKPNVLNWVETPCYELTLHIVGPKIKQINLVDKDFNFMAKLKVTTLKNGAQLVEFEMLSDMASTLHTKEDDPNYIENADFYFELISTNGAVNYTSVRY